MKITTTTTTTTTILIILIIITTTKTTTTIIIIEWRMDQFEVYWSHYYILVVPIPHGFRQYILFGSYRKWEFFY